MKKFEEKLIELVRKNQLLYNKKLKDFKNLPVKTEKWNLISKELNVDKHTCITRWKSLRDRFTRELKLQMNQQRLEATQQSSTSITSPSPFGSGGGGGSGSGSGQGGNNNNNNTNANNPRREWEYFKNLQFLSNHCAINRTATANSPEHIATVYCGDPFVDTEFEDFSCSSSTAAESSSISYNNDNNKINDINQNNPNDSNQNIIIKYETNDPNIISSDHPITSDNPITNNNNNQNNNQNSNNNSNSNNVETELLYTMKALRTYIKNDVNAENQFIKSVIALLNGLNGENKMIAQKRIMEYLCKCQLEQLNNGNIENVIL